MWAESWPAADVERIAGLYADDALFLSHPFRERQVAHAYVAWAFAEQAAADCRFGEPVVDGTRAAIDWWAAITDMSGNVQSIAGTSLLQFDAAGRVVEQRDAWGYEEGRHDPTEWAPAS